MPKENALPSTFEDCHKLVCEKVKQFDDNFLYYKDKTYLEAQVRSDFLDPLFIALGWDVLHKMQTNPYMQEVKIEKTQKQEGSKNKKFADYAFHLAPDYKNPVFFVEAKKPAAVLEDNKEYYLQTHKYGWNAQVPMSVLTDFEEFIIIDCRSKPDIKYSHNTVVKKYHYKDFLDVEKFKEIYYLFSREAVEAGSIQNFVKNHMPSQKGKARKAKLFSGAYKSVDDDFLDYIDSLRFDLASGFVAKNPNISSTELTEATQKTIDRLVFIRFLEDKQIEYDNHIYDIKKWAEFISLSEVMDTKYNGVVFKPSIIDSSSFFGIDDDLFMDICIDISSNESPYNFNAIPIHIIGNIYERFLGEVVTVNNGEVSIEMKPEVRKAGGVFYTPKYIVDYLVNKSVGTQIIGKTPKEIDQMSFADISCGSGSFLIGVYDCLLDYHKEYYHSKLQDKTKLDKRSDDYGNVVYREGDWFITLKRKQEILLNCVFGVDIDSQAVEVTQLSLFLKLLEEESLGTTIQTTLMSKVLPDLTSNIKCGNSLVGWDVSTNMGGLSSDEEMQVSPFDYRTEFPTVFPKGFDALVGNPPYVKEGKIDKRVMEHIKNSYLAPYYQGKMDIWYFFVCNGLDLLKDDGLLGYIAPNNWTTNAGASKLRNKVVRDSQIIEMIDFGSYMVFKDASIQTMNFILKKNATKDNYSFLHSKLVNHSNSALDAISLLKQKKIINNVILNPKLKRQDFIDNYLVFGNKEDSKLLTKIKSKANFTFDKKLELTQGIVAPQDTVNKKSSALLNIPISTGIFILTNNEAQKLSLSQKELSLLKPLFTSIQVKRYFTDRNSDFKVIYTTSSFKDPNSLNSYPKIKSHLDKFQPAITSSNKPYGLHRSRKESFFKGSKIIALRKCSNLPIFSFSDFDCYVTQSFNVIKSNRINLKYLTAILNSKLIRFWLLKKGKMQGDNFQLDTGPLLDIPIVNSKDKTEVTKLAQLVDDITLAKQNQTNATTQKEQEFLDKKIVSIENQINVMVYDLYDITPIEVLIIES
jgi:adenine-specific DNA-methyltransferase